MSPLSPSPDLIAFLQALPDGRQRRGVCYPQWLLLLMAILGILSGCRSGRDLERFAKRHHQAFGAALDLELPKAPCDSTFLYLFERVELEQLFGLLRQWMLAQIADQDKDVDQLICDGKTLRGSAAQPDGSDGATRFVTQVTLATEQGADLLLTVKKNQRRLRQQIISQFRGHRHFPVEISDFDASHGRSVRRTLRARNASEAICERWARSLSRIDLSADRTHAVAQPN